MGNFENLNLPSIEELQEGERSSEDLRELLDDLENISNDLSESIDELFKLSLSSEISGEEKASIELEGRELLEQQNLIIEKISLIRGVLGYYNTSEIQYELGDGCSIDQSSFIEEFERNIEWQEKYERYKGLFPDIVEYKEVIINTSTNSLSIIEKVLEVRNEGSEETKNINFKISLSLLHLGEAGLENIDNLFDIDDRLTKLIIESFEFNDFKDNNAIIECILRFKNGDINNTDLFNILESNTHNPTSLKWLIKDDLALDSEYRNYLESKYDIPENGIFNRLTIFGEKTDIYGLSYFNEINEHPDLKNILDDLLSLESIDNINLIINRLENYNFNSIKPTQKAFDFIEGFKDLINEVMFENTYDYDFSQGDEQLPFYDNLKNLAIQLYIADLEKNVSLNDTELNIIKNIIIESDYDSLINNLSDIEDTSISGVKLSEIGLYHYNPDRFPLDFSTSSSSPPEQQPQTPDAPQENQAQTQARERLIGTYGRFAIELLESGKAEFDENGNFILREKIEFAGGTIEMDQNGEKFLVNNKGCQTKIELNSIGEALRAVERLDKLNSAGLGALGEDFFTVTDCLIAVTTDLNYSNIFAGGKFNTFLERINQIIPTGFVDGSKNPPMTYKNDLVTMTNENLGSKIFTLSGNLTCTSEELRGIMLDKFI